MQSKSLNTILDTELLTKLSTSRILVVGAGGIGCELLKNLVLSGFTNLVILDLDTIEVSNLNRQFLFRKQHVGSAKALIAKEAALKFNPNINIEAYQLNIKDEQFSTEYLSQFNLVFSALDNFDARSYLNALCFRANIPLLESGTRGYAGQSYSILHGLTQCQGCITPPEVITFAMCTIRNTPEKPEHCVAWAKHIFAALFGEPEDGENASFGVDFDHVETLHLDDNNGNNNQNNTNENKNNNNDMNDTTTTNTNIAAINIGQDGKVETADMIDMNDYQQLTKSIEFLQSLPKTTPLQQLLYKIFQIIYYYFTYDLVQQRRYKLRWIGKHPPCILSLPLPQNISQSINYISAVPTPDMNPSTILTTPITKNNEIYYTHQIGAEKQQLIQPIGFYMNQFITSLYDLFQRRNELIQLHGINCQEQFFTFDKDDTLAMSFVTAASNLRMYCYHIPIASEFTIKGIAGNIIHAIATTNAIVAGLLVSHAYTILQNNIVLQYIQSPTLFTIGQTTQLFNYVQDKFSSSATLATKYIAASQPDIPSIKCWCTKPIVEVIFDDIENENNNNAINPYDKITGQQFMLLIEAIICGMVYYKRIRTNHTNITTILENSTNIEDLTFGPINMSTKVINLDERLDGFYFKYKTIQNCINGNDNTNNDNDDDDCSDDDDDDNDANPIIFKTLSTLNYSHGTTLTAQQIENGLIFVIKCYLQSLYTTKSRPIFTSEQEHNEYTKLITTLIQSNPILKPLINTIHVYNNYSLQEPTIINNELYHIQIIFHNGLIFNLSFNLDKLINIIPRWLAHKKSIQDQQDAEWKKVQQSKIRQNQYKNHTTPTTAVSLDLDDVDNDNNNNDDDDVTQDDSNKKPKTTLTTTTLTPVTSVTNDLAMVSLGPITTTPPPLSTIKTAQDDIICLSDDD